MKTNNFTIKIIFFILGIILFTLFVVLTGLAFVNIINFSKLYFIFLLLGSICQIPKIMDIVNNQPKGFSYYQYRWYITLICIIILSIVVLIFF